MAREGRKQGVLLLPQEFLLHLELSAIEQMKRAFCSLLVFLTWQSESILEVWTDFSAGEGGERVEIVRISSSC